MMIGAKNKTSSLLMFLGTLAFVLVCVWIYGGDIAAGEMPLPLILFGSWLPLATLMMLRAWGRPDPALLNPTVNFIFRTSVAEKFVMIIAAAGFVVGGYGLVTGALGQRNPIDTGVGWFGIAFFGLCGLVGLFSRSPALTLSRDGIAAPAIGIDLVPWRDIRGVTARRLLRSSYVALEVQDEESFLARGSAKLKRGAATARRFNLPLFCFAPQMFGTNAEDLQAAIDIRWRHYADDQTRDSKETT